MTAATNDDRVCAWMLWRLAIETGAPRELVAEYEARRLAMGPPVRCDNVTSKHPR